MGLKYPAFFRVVIFYDGGPPCKRQDLFLFDTESFPIIFFDRDDLDGLLLPRCIDHLNLFCPQLLLEDRLESRFKGRFEDIKFIGVDRPLDDHLTQTVSPR